VGFGAWGGAAGAAVGAVGAVIVVGGWSDCLVVLVPLLLLGGV